MGDMRKMETSKGPHTFFKLQSTMSTTSMVLFDSFGVLRRYETPEEIMKEFYDLRLKMYEKRKKFMEGSLGADACKLSNQARFILEKCDGTLKIENKKKKMMIEELSRRGYDSDPVKAWKKTQKSYAEEEENANIDEAATDDGDDGKGPDYDYLLSMPMWNLTQEKKDALCKNRDEKNQQLKKLQATKIEDMWRKDLDDFVEKLDQVEAKENEEAASAADAFSKMKKSKGKGGKGLKTEFLPSSHAIRINPVIADDLKVKASKAVAAKERKDKGEDKKRVKKEEKEEVDEFDLMASEKNVSLSKKIGTPTKEKKKRAPKGSPGEKKKGGKTKNPWSDSDASDVDDSDLSDAMDSVEVAPRERAGGKRAAASKAKFKYDDDSEDGSDKSDDEELHDNPGIKESNGHHAATDGSDDDDSHFIEPTPPKKTAPAKRPPAKKKVLDSDSDNDFPANGNGAHDDSDDSPIKKKPAAKKAPAKKLTSSDDLFDSMMSNGDKKPAPKKKPVKKKIVSDDDDSGSEFGSQPVKKPAAKKPAASKKPAVKKAKFDSDSEDFNMDDVAPARPGRGKKPVNYGGGGSESEDSDSDFV